MPDHGEGGQGLAQEVEGKAHDAGGVVLQEGLQALPEVGEEDIRLGMFGRANEVCAPQRGEGAVLKVVQVQQGII